MKQGRPSDNPLIVHIHSKGQLKDFTYTLDPRVEKLMQAFWPGPISFILPLKPGYLCRKVSGGLSSVAVRMPSHSVGRQLLQIINEPLAAPSANLSGRLTNNFQSCISRFEWTYRWYRTS